MRGKKLLSLLLALILCLSLLPAALAEEPVGVIAPAEAPNEEKPGVIAPAEPGSLPGEKTGWALPLRELPAADEINVTEHTIDVPDVKLEDLTDESVYQAMMAKKADFPEGMHWTNDDFYAWNGGVFSGGYGCAGFAFLLSDAAFGYLPAQMMDVDYETLRTGDILRINNDSHTRWLGPVDLDSCSISVTIEPTSFHFEEDFTMIATVKDKNGKAVGGEVVYFSIMDEQGSVLYTKPLGYTYCGTMTDRNGQAMFSYTFHKADGKIQPGKYLAFAKLNDPWQESLPSATCPFTLLDDTVPDDTVGTIVLSDAQARPGEEFTLTVDLTDNPGVFALRFHVDYDSSLLRFLGVEDGSLTGWIADTDTGMLLWDSPVAGDKTDTESIVKLRFQVLEDAEDCETAVSFDSAEAANYAVEDLKFDLKPAAVVISSALPGDTNDDESVNVLDLVRLRKYLVNSSTPINETNADLDGDGTVALRDLVLLRKLLVGAEP